MAPDLFLNPRWRCQAITSAPSLVGWATANPHLVVCQKREIAESTVAEASCDNISVNCLLLLENENESLLNLSAQAMDSSEEISDNILEYLLDNGRDCDSSFLTEGENVSTATDNEPIYGSEFDSTLNPVSLHFAKKLEWDSSADVGSLPQKISEVNAKLSTLERMALSNSASKLCTDDDEKLLAKIDRVLARSRQPSRTLERLTRRPPKLPTWATVDSGSNASVDTVIPNINEIDPTSATIKKQSGSSKLVKSQSHECQACDLSDNDSNYQSRNYKDDINYVSHTHAKYRQQISPDSDKLCSGTSKTLYCEASSEMFITRSVASEDGDLKAGNSERSLSMSPTHMAEQEIPPSECRCMSVDISERTCPTHTSLSTEHTRRLHREALGELHMYRGLKEHLKSLRGIMIIRGFPA